MPKTYSINEYGNRMIVLARIYFDVLSIPINTGSIGTFTSAYSSRI
ncbi:uncharacterized protein METZ01_LOCUS192036, partial [marine metagenome]